MGRGNGPAPLASLDLSGLATAADAPDLSIERDILRIALFGHGGGTASPGLTMRRSGCQGRRDGWVRRPRPALPDVAMRVAM
jgi:hypothetical protein